MNNMNDSMMVVTQPTEDDDGDAAGDDEVKLLKSQKPKTSSPPTKTNNNKDENEEKERGKRPVDTLPDMTGKIITVSAEETLQLTKERKGSRSSRKRPTDKKDNNASSSSSAQPQDANNKNTHASSEDIEKEFQGFIAKLSLTKNGEESNSSVAVADTTNRSYKPIKSSSVLSSSDNRTSTSGERIDSSERDYVNDGETNQACIMQRRKSEFLSDFTVETETEGLPPQSAISTSASNRRGSDTLTGGHTNTIDENESIDSWSKTDEQTSTRNKSETTLIDSSGDLADYYNSNNNNSRLPSRSNRTYNNGGFHHRSSLRSSSNWERERGGESTVDNNNNNDGGGRPGLNRGISWASLISMESKKKQEEKLKQLNSYNSSDISPSHSRSRRKGRDRGDLNSSLVSNSTLDSSRYTRTSYSSHKSYSSRKSSDNHSRKSSDSKHSKRSTGSRGTRSVSWKNESTMSIINSALNHNDNDGISSAKDPKYIRKQAREKFERGLHYASIGKYAASRERFLMALRYRVMHYGPMHYNVAAVHEMLGNINYCLSEEVEEDEFEPILLRSSGSSRKDGHSRRRRGSIDERGGGDDDDEEGLAESMLGWDVTILENEKSTNTRSRVYLEKAAMHYRTVLDILCSKKKDKSKSSSSSKQSLDGGESTAKRSATNSLQSSTSGRGGVKFGTDTTFNWSEIADTYNDIDDNGDSDEDDDDRSLMEVIVTRVKKKLSSMPAAVKGNNKSYAWIKKD